MAQFKNLIFKLQQLDAQIFIKSLILLITFALFFMVLSQYQYPERKVMDKNSNTKPETNVDNDVDTDETDTDESDTDVDEEEPVVDDELSLDSETIERKHLIENYMASYDIDPEEKLYGNSNGYIKLELLDYTVELILPKGFYISLYTEDQCSDGDESYFDLYGSEKDCNEWQTERITQSAHVYGAIHSYYNIETDTVEPKVENFLIISTKVGNETIPQMSAKLASYDPRGFTIGNLGTYLYYKDGYGEGFGYSMYENTLYSIYTDLLDYSIYANGISTKNVVCKNQETGEMEYVLTEFPEPTYIEDFYKHPEVIKAKSDKNCKIIDEDTTSDSAYAKYINMAQKVLSSIKITEK